MSLEQEKDPNSFLSHVQMAPNGSFDRALSYQNAQTRTYNPGRTHYPSSNDPSSVACTQAQTQDLMYMNSERPKGYIGNSSPQQILLSAAIANLIPQFASSMDCNADLNIDMTSPEFIAMVSAAATHYANVGLPSNNFFDANVQQSCVNNSMMIEQNDSVPSVIETETTENRNTAASITSTSSPICKSSFPRHRSSSRLNKFVRRLHDMLVTEKVKGIVEWRCGLLILHSTDAFAKKILPKYFNTRNFKTFRRQLNYYGFVHVRSFSTTGCTTTALWVNQDLASRQAQFPEESDNISSVLLLKRVDPCPDAKTAEGRRVRKEEAVNTVEDIGLNTNWMQLNHFKRVTKSKEPQIDNSSTVTTSDSNSACNEEFFEKKDFSIDHFQQDKRLHLDNALNDLPTTEKSIGDNGSGGLTIQANSPSNIPSCDDAANLLLNLSRSACVSP